MSPTKNKTIQDHFQTVFFDVNFARTKKNLKGRKFPEPLMQSILEAVKLADQVLYSIFTFSQCEIKGDLYLVPIIFEKVSKKIFENKHKNHYAMIDYPPQCCDTWGHIDIKGKTAIISLCSTSWKDKQNLYETVTHELTHAFMNSFLDGSGVNNQNRVFFLEAMAEWIGQLCISNPPKVEED